MYRNTVILKNTKISGPPKGEMHKDGHLAKNYLEFKEAGKKVTKKMT